MKHSKLSIATIILSILFFPAAIVTGLIDILKGSKEEKHVLTYVGFGIAVLVLIIGITNQKPSSSTSTPEVKEQEAVQEEIEEAPQEEESALPDEEYKLPDGVDPVFSKSVPNDVTGRWRLSLIASTTPAEEYAAPYYHLYFESDDEVHAVVNFTLKTTSMLTKVGNKIDVATYEYVDKEEHDAKKMPSGMKLAEYLVDIETGEIEKIN